jgi:glycosyltransferase involved in cell wall biosynthesis
MKIFHLLKLRGIGGVQSQFEVFYNNLTSKQKSFNYIINTSKIDKTYSSLLRNGNNFILKFLTYFFSNDVIIHSYNNLVSSKYYTLFKIIHPSNLIYHERGNAWNLDSSKKNLVIKNSNLSKLILCNSEAAKIILNKKFDVNMNKIKVIYNGVVSDEMIKETKKTFKQQIKGKFIIGYVGRLETNKGVQSLIKTMQFLDQEKFQLNIIGDGSLRNKLEKYAAELNINSIKFFGRIDNAWSEMKNFDILVVPSIREPLGNVVIEAALNRVPVIASKVDGIPEIIDNFETGILISPSLPVNSYFISKSVPLPEYVVDISTKTLKKPMELDPIEIMEAIKFLNKNKTKADKFSEKLYKSVINKFHVKKYIQDLSEIYQEIL